MSNVSELLARIGGGGNLRSQIFNSSGTFTPSAVLLAKGGRVIVRGIGGGSSGAVGAFSKNSSITDAERRSPMGGNAGRYREAIVQVTGPVTVTIGAGGTSVTVTSTAGSGTLQTANGNAGGTSTFGALASFPGGAAPIVDGLKAYGGGGDGCYGRGKFLTDGTNVTDARGGEGINGIGGGGGGTASIGPHRAAVDGAGSAAFGLSGGTATGGSTAANSGAGGGAAWCEHGVAGALACTATSGSGATGFIEVIWME